VAFIIAPVIVDTGDACQHTRLMSQGRNPRAAQTLRQIVKSLDVSQNEAGRRLGLASGALSHILRDRQSVSLFVALVLMRGFGIDPRVWLTADERRRLEKVESLITTPSALPDSVRCCD
jgi:plasmid maintenance system antidote protein VapI